jgi:hypothetical protein
MLVSRCVGRGQSGRGVVAPSNAMGPDQAVWALRIVARDRYSDRCWGWGEQLAEPVGLKDHAELPLQATCSVSRETDSVRTAVMVFALLKWPVARWAAGEPAGA